MDATVRHDGNLVSAARHCAPLAAQLPATHAWKGPRATRWWMRWSAGTEWWLAAVVVLSRPRACRSPGLAGMRGAYVGLGCLCWPSRQAPLAGVLSPWLGYFVLEWLQRNHGGPWRSPGKPCRGMLRLPVHKFGILGYPYSSTPTGAPGPGPHTVPSAVGPGPKQGTGTRGAWVMPNLTPYPLLPP